MILTELSEEELRESEKKIKNELKFILSKIAYIFFYLGIFLLVVIYIYFLAEKSRVEKVYSTNQEILKNLELEIKIQNNLITTYSSIKAIKKRLNTKDFFLPQNIWYIYENDLIKLKGD